MRNLLTSAATAVLLGMAFSAGCGGGDVDGISTGGAGGFDGGSIDSSTGGAGGADGSGTCRPSGAVCASATDCCTLACDNGTCGGTQCTADNQPCTTSAQCCSGTCNASGACAPLNPTCRTLGNPCSAHGECCSKLCTSGVCATGSFCAQNGDACTVNGQCCGGLCKIAQGATVGVCSQPDAPGTTGCLVAGIACGAVSDGGSGGVPQCGGECCSRACAPHRTGLLVCQPPSGCHPTGEICTTDADCCGGVGTPNSQGVKCSKANAADPVGRCDNGQACRPAGAVCKLATNSCNAENNCCAGNVNQNPFVCQQDNLGIPRCTLTGKPCDDAGSKAGQACATSADCCGLSCVPNPSYTPGGSAPPFVCGGECVGQGGACTTAADCCPGLPCTLPPGSTRGTCGNPPPPPDAGPPPPVDAAVPDGGTCAEYGQSCSTNSDCCNNVPCTNGRCVYIIK